MGATAHLPPLCRRLFKFHRLHDRSAHRLHDRSALCLLRIQDRGPDVRPSTDKRWETPIPHSSGPCVPGPCAYSRVWTLDTLSPCGPTTCSRVITGLVGTPGYSRSFILPRRATNPQFREPLQEGSTGLPSCVVLCVCVCSCVVHNLSPSLLSPTQKCRSL